MKKIIPLVAVILIFAACQKNSVRTRVTENSSASELTSDFNTTGKYALVKIGTQRWMATNLHVNRYRNGDIIPEVKDKSKWAVLTTGAWCWYNNDSATGAVYGKLYNWYAFVDPRGLAPTGWHVPSYEEWGTLSTFLGNNPGGKLKDTGTIEAGTGLWFAPNANANNKTGFTGLPGGYCSSHGAFSNIGYNGYWWTGKESQPYSSYYRYLSYSSGSLILYNDSKRCGFSVRCIKD